MIRVLVADDHAFVAEAVAHLLRDEHDIEVVACVPTGAHAVHQVSEFAVDVVLIARHVALEALEVIGSIRKRSPSTGVVILAQIAEVSDAARALRAGATGYVSAMAPANEVLAALRACARGHRYIEPGIADAVLALLIDPRHDSDPLARLSTREHDIVRFIVEGRRKVEIAHLLSLSPKTVETYRARAMDKLGLRDLPGLIRYAIRRGIVPLD